MTETKIISGSGDTIDAACIELVKNVAKLFTQSIEGLKTVVLAENTTTVHYAVYRDNPDVLWGISIKTEKNYSNTAKVFRFYLFDVLNNTTVEYATVAVTSELYNSSTKTLSIQLKILKTSKGVFIYGSESGSKNTPLYGFSKSESLTNLFVHGIFYPNTGSENFFIVNDNKVGFSANSGYHALPGYSVPQPGPNKCTMSNAIYNGKIVTDVFAYNCNPVLVPSLTNKYMEVMLGGEMYLACANNCCIKL